MLVNPEVPDKTVNVRQAVKEIMQVLDTFPEIREIIRLKITKQYNG